MSPRLLGETLAEKLLLNSARDGDCLRWQRSHSRTGYGRIRHEGRQREAHILAYELWVGPIPEGHELDHVWRLGCRFKDCLEPRHLQAVSHGENMGRIADRISECPHGHAYTPENTIYETQRGRKARYCKTCRNGRKRKQVAA